MRRLRLLMLYIFCVYLISNRMPGVLSLSYAILALDQIEALSISEPESPS